MWCNGNTKDFDSFILRSSRSIPAKNQNCAHSFKEDASAVSQVRLPVAGPRHRIPLVEEMDDARVHAHNFSHSSHFFLAFAPLLGYTIDTVRKLNRGVKMEADAMTRKEYNREILKMNIKSLLKCFDYWMYWFGAGCLFVWILYRLGILEILAKTPWWFWLGFGAFGLACVLLTKEEDDWHSHYHYPGLYDYKPKKPFEHKDDESDPFTRKNK